MAGRIKVYERYGASPGTEIDTDGHLYFTEDSDGTVTHETSPIGKPTGATNTSYSYEKWFRFKVTIAPDNLFTNFKVWSGTLTEPVTGISFKVGSAISYVTPVITQSNEAVHLLHSTYPTYDDAMSISGNLVNVGDSTNYAVIQAQVNQSADTGTADRTKTIIHFAFDES